jgi:hypothetical protein
MQRNTGSVSGGKPPARSLGLARLERDHRAGWRSYARLLRNSNEPGYTRNGPAKSSLPEGTKPKATAEPEAFAESDTPHSSAQGRSLNRIARAVTAKSSLPEGTKPKATAEPEASAEPETPQSSAQGRSRNRIAPDATANSSLPEGTKPTATAEPELCAGPDTPQPSAQARNRKRIAPAANAKSPLREGTKPTARPVCKAVDPFRPPPGVRPPVSDTGPLAGSPAYC